MLTATQECSPWPHLGTASDQAPAEAAPAPTCLSSAHPASVELAGQGASASDLVFREN